jgi:hypothetical protein
MSATADCVRLVIWRGYDDGEEAAASLEARGIELDVAYVDADEGGSACPSARDPARGRPCAASRRSSARTWDSATPTEEAYPWLDTWALVRGAPNEDGACAWVDWMIGPQAQRIVPRNLPSGTENRRAVEVLDAEVRDVFPHGEIDGLTDAYYVGPPPEEAIDGVTTLTEWYEAWEAVRTA